MDDVEIEQSLPFWKCLATIVVLAAAILGIMLFILPRPTGVEPQMPPEQPTTQPAQMGTEAPSTEPAQPAVGPPPYASNPTLFNIRKSRELILARQLPDGAFPIRVTEGDVWIVPYFGNLAAIALMNASDFDENPADLDAAFKWLRWYTAHAEPSGIVYNRQGTAEIHTSTNRTDAADSTAATFLSAVRTWQKMSGDENAGSFLGEPAARSLDLIETLMDSDGLTFMKPGVRHKSLMNNIEICVGLRDAARFFEAAGEKEQAERATALFERSRAGLSKFWHSEKSFYASALGPNGEAVLALRQFSPDYMAQLYALAYLAPARPELWKQMKAVRPKPSLALAFWLLAAQQAGSTEEIENLKLRLAEYVNAMPETTDLLEPALAIIAQMAHERVQIEQ